MRLFVVVYFTVIFVLLPTVALNCTQLSFRMPVLHSGGYCPADQLTTLPSIVDDLVVGIGQVTVTQLLAAVTLLGVGIVGALVRIDSVVIGRMIVWRFLCSRLWNYCHLVCCSRLNTQLIYG